MPTETVAPATLKKKINKIVSAKKGALEGGKQGVMFIDYQYFKSRPCLGWRHLTALEMASMYQVRKR